MKFKVKGDREEVLSVCKEICKIKGENEKEIKSSGLKQKAIKGLVDKAASISGGINFDDAFQSLVVNYYEEKGNVMVSIPFYVPSMARFILKRKLTKAFQEIFDKSCKKKVKVDFVDWGV